MSEYGELPQIKLVPIEQVKFNPNNPRVIKDEAYKKLISSLKEFPKMLKYRMLIVNPNMEVLGGNMRLKAAQELGFKMVPILQENEFTEEQRDEFIIKDNVGFGEWDYLELGKWDAEKLDEWNVVVYNVEDVNLDEFFEDNTNEEKETKSKIVLEYIEEDYNIITKKFDSIDGSKEKIVWDLLGL